MIWATRFLLVGVPLYDTGYRGASIYELLVCSDTIRTMINERAPTAVPRQRLLNSVWSLCGGRLAQHLRW
jgi:hypothetical protein